MAFGLLLGLMDVLGSGCLESQSMGGGGGGGTFCALSCVVRKLKSFISLVQPEGSGADTSDEYVCTMVCDCTRLVQDALHYW